MPATPRSRLPPRLLPVLYFGIAHAALALACLAVALDPRGVSGFFYHARMLGIVHLVTLGWITASILGVALHRRPDRAACLDSGDVARLHRVRARAASASSAWWRTSGCRIRRAWPGRPSRSGPASCGRRARRLAGLRGAPLPRAVSAHIMLAFLNVGGAATLGVLIGFDKVYHFLPGFVLANVFAHAHLAAIGWASMMVVGIAYRLLPMVLPAAMPKGPTIWVSAVLLESRRLSACS